MHASPRNKQSLFARAQPLLAPRALEALAALSEKSGLEKNDLAELLILSGAAQQLHDTEQRLDLRTDGQLSEFVLNSFRHDRAVAVPRVDRKLTRTFPDDSRAQQLSEIADANVLVLRMAHQQDAPEEMTPPSGGYPRRGLGMELSMGAEEVWERARGYWRVRPDADYLVPTRLGYAPYVFVTEAWRTASDTTLISDKSARFWAQRGWQVDLDAERLIPLGDTPERAISDRDRTIALMFKSKVVRFPKGVRNPTVWVGRREG